jgi:transglutaminase-like putative cysteine protease
LPPDDKPGEPICTDYASQGLLRIYYLNDSGKRLKLQVIHGEDTVYYNLAGDGENEDFSLQYGDGEYTVRIMQNIENDQYFAVETKTFEVKLDDATRAFLNSIQNVNWNYDMQPIHDVRYIVADSLDETDELKFSCTEDIYSYVVKNIQYDTAKVFDLLYDYLPDIVDTYTTNKGICYDYAALLAAMLRSIGIPAKLVKGYASYAPDTYHAWNEVFIDGEWITVDPTRDATLHASGMAYDLRKEDVDYTIVYEY